MPVAQAQAAAVEGQWETVCTMQDTCKVWVSGNDADSDHQDKTNDRSSLCIMSHAGIAPAVFNFATHATSGNEVGLLEFTTVYLTRAWSEPATDPPAL